MQKQMLHFLTMRRTAQEAEFSSHMLHSEGKDRRFLEGVQLVGTLWVGTPGGFLGRTC